MNMLKQAILLWKGERKGSTLQRRLILFFALVVISVILAFTLLLFLFGITGSGKQAVQKYLESELSHSAAAVTEDFSNLSVTGIALAQALADRGDAFFEEHGLTASDLARQPEYIEQLLSRQMPDLLATADNNACGGVFVVLDATVKDDAERMAGVFMKKTQPVSSASLPAKEYWLRGPAPVAREYGIELLGQWKMEYEASELPFFDSVMETARENPDAALSRLYYWSGRICLDGNSEEGLLLCLPLRSGDGTVYGICGIEVSDRMFKSLYSPNESEWSGVFTLAAPMEDGVLHAGQGLLAGNNYLSGTQFPGDLTADGEERGFPCFAGKSSSYAGMYKTIRLHTVGSPYEGEEWAVAVLMSRPVLSDAVRGSSVYLYLIVGALLVLSLIACVAVSRKYLHPIHRGFSAIREQAYGSDDDDLGIHEIDELFDFLAEKDLAHEAALQEKASEVESLRGEHEKAQSEIARLAYHRRQEADPDSYEHFLRSVDKLTATERKVFDLYMDGKTTKEIIALMGFKEFTLKFHNKNIYEKLGVSSRKELLRYAALMRQEQEGGIK